MLRQEIPNFDIHDKNFARTLQNFIKNLLLNLGSRGWNVVIEIVVRRPYMTLACLIIRYRIGSRKYDRACFIIVLVFFLVAQQTQNLVENSYRDSIPFHPKPRLQKILQPSNSISVVSWFFYRKFDAEMLCKVQEVYSYFSCRALDPDKRNFKTRKFRTVSKGQKHLFLGFFLHLI